MEWAKRRQIYYATGVFLLFTAIISPFIWKLIHHKPTCFDGIQNQGETSVDKGGPCKLLDERVQKPLLILWSRAFKIRPGLYSTVAYIENPNPKSGILSIPYHFKLYNSENILIAERFGNVPILPGRVMPILETGIETGNRDVARVTFQFLRKEVWVKMFDESKKIDVYDEVFKPGKIPRVDAKTKNSDVIPKKNVIFVATLFDEVGNALASSRTYLERMEPDKEYEISFTWPKPFKISPTRIDVQPLIAPRVKF